MELFESTIVLLVAAVALAALARRWQAPYPAFLAVLGVVLALLPGMPHVELDPRLALALFVAPVLLDAAYDASPRDLRRNWLSISGLVLVAVGVTTAAVAWVAKLLVPELPWAAAVAIGAIVAPPDAAAATTVLRSAQPPHRIVQILEGESLFNDATALFTYRVAVAAAAGDINIAGALPMLALAVVGSVIAGYGLARLFLWLSRHLDDIPMAIVLQFAATFGVWIVAERVGLSGILTVVAYAITVARTAPTQTPARIRIPSYAVWETMVFVLNALAFVLIGLQLGPIVAGLRPEQRTEYVAVAMAALATCVFARLGWVMLNYAVARLKVARADSAKPRPLGSPTAGSGLVIGWCGMRGIVTIAAALALPASFPGRSLALVTAFTVVLGTLLVQGLTLRPLLLWLKLKDDLPVEREEAAARAAAMQAALAAIEGETSKAGKALRLEIRTLLADAEESADAADEEHARQSATHHAQLRRRAVEAARARLAAMREQGEIGDDAFHRIERELDRSEVHAETFDRD